MKSSFDEIVGNAEDAIPIALDRPDQRPAVGNPKLREGTSTFGKWRYYPAFSTDFAYRCLTKLSRPDRANILDAWNGSGTTTAAAAFLGISSIGIDRNPVMRVLAQSRVASEDALELVDRSIEQLAEQQIQHSVNATISDPLRKWFSASTTSNIRALFFTTFKLLDVMTRSRNRPNAVEWSVAADEARSVITTAMFAVVRESLSAFLTSNPTWIRIPKEHPGNIDIAPTFLRSLFLSALSGLLTQLRLERRQQRVLTRPRIVTASSTALPIPDESISAIVSSPPYGTRIDYAVATAFECAVLGLSFGLEFPRLRRALIGTTTVQNFGGEVPELWGRVCRELLHAIRSHQSHASPIYYYKNWWGYFFGIRASLQELHRVLEKGGECTLVVQDSHYKDIRVPLQSIYTEMAAIIGLNLIEQTDFPSLRNKASIHPHASTWRSSSPATESVLVFAKGK